MTKIFLVLFFCFFISCENKDSVPKNILPKEKMEQVLWDMIEADQFSKQFIAKDSTKNINTENIQLYNQIFQLHHITETDFRRSYQFYTSRPDIFKVVLDSLSIKAGRRMNELYKSSVPTQNPKLKKLTPK